MKKLFLLIAIVLTGSSAFSQRQSSSRSQTVTLNPNSGYVNINELQYGFGLYTRTGPYDAYYFGFTTMHGYQLNISGSHINRSFMILGATGIFIYNDGALIPLYIDLRYIWNLKKVSPFLFGDSGLLINYEEVINGTKMFINPGAGVKIGISRTLSTTIGAGLQVQMGEEVTRNSFINVKAGLVFKPQR
jgi:hypothetical protein